MSVAPKTRPHHERPHLPSGQFHRRENGPHKRFPVELTGVRKFSLPEQDLHFLKKSLSGLFPPAFFFFTNISKRIHRCSLTDLDVTFNKRTCRVNNGYTFIHKTTYNFIASYLANSR